MHVHNNLNDKIKTIFLVKLTWTLLMLLSVIYCTVILAISNVIGHFSWVLLTMLIFNCISLIFSIVDVWTMMINNEREKDAWFFGMMYGMFAIIVPMAYYIHMGSVKASGKEYNLIGYEFAIILIYTIVYVFIIIWMIIAGIVALVCCIMKTRKVVTERENHNSVKDSSDVEVQLDISTIKYQEMPIEE